MGIGRANTPEAFQKACEIFIFTENLNPEETAKEITKEKPKRKTRAKVIKNKSTVAAKKTEPEETEIIPEAKPEESKTVPVIKNKITKTPLDKSLINKAFEMAEQDDDLAYLSGIGIQLRRLDPSFDPRTYGFYSLTGLFKSLPDDYEFVFKSRGSPPFIRKKIKM